VDYSALYTEAEGLAKGGGSPSDRLKKISDLLKDKVPHYNWFGFYIAKAGQKELDLGPFAGEPTEHVKIGFGQGICGQAAEKAEAVVVGDVSKETNYLACSVKVKSEIVVPVFAPGSFDYDTGKGKGEVTGEIDIDSWTANAFSDEDNDFLESLAILVAADVEALHKAG